MLKRLAVISECKKLDEKTVKAALEKGARLIAVKPAGNFPAGAAAALGAADSIDQSLDAALAAAEQHEELLMLLANSLDSREGLLPGSSRRVAEHAARLADALGLDDEQKLVLERAALLRDIGKIAIPNEVLLKSSLLKYDDWMLIQKHPHLGAKIAEQNTALNDIADTVKMHHESYDGDGYPEKLEGEDIPPLARALKIIDVYCAMTSPRLYRKGFSTHEEAIEHLRSEQGKHFDPALVDMFISENVGQPWKDVEPK